MSREAVIEQVCQGRLIAIVRGVEAADIVPLARALYAGGISLVEVTFDQARPDSFAATAGAIAALRRALPGQVLPGAGTVMSREQVEMAAEAGAAYIISPNTDAAVVQRTRALGLVSMPGAFTPSEAAMAHALGADFVKLFPADVLGPGYLKALRAPLGHIRFLAVGGIGEENAADYLAAGAVGLGVGGKLVNREWIAAGAFDKITALATRYTRAAGRQV